MYSYNKLLFAVLLFNSFFVVGNAETNTTLPAETLLNPNQPVYDVVYDVTYPNIVERNVNTEFNVTNSAAPSNLKYFKYYDVLPDDIVLTIFDKKDLNKYMGKHIFIGYGIVDPKGKNCRVFTPEYTGLDHNITICLPWWRAERVYEKSATTVNDNQNILCSISKPKPPIMVNVCKKWESATGNNVGGKVTCTTYYSRTKKDKCWDNPIQPDCFVDNCSPYVKQYCTKVGAEMGDANSLQTAYEYQNHIYAADTKLKVVTHQYECPKGTFTPYSKCIEKESVLMYPYTCVPDDPTTAIDDGVYIYCDENKPQYDVSGNIIGFLGQCPDGRNVICDVNSINQQKTKCIEPIEQNITNTTYKEQMDVRDYEDVEVDVLSGMPDIYAQNPNCIRTNTVEDARSQVVYAHIIGDGYLDDDIYILRHRPGVQALKVYCNMQHAENVNNSKFYDGQTLQCIDNNGNYKFDSKIEIQPNDIVSVQQATENENKYGSAYFPIGRTHYRSTKLEIDGVLVAPNTFPSNYPYYPSSDYLKIWENTLGTLSILFPYAGAYKLYFFNKSGELLASKVIDVTNFEKMSDYGNLQLKLAPLIKLAPKFKNVTIDDKKLCLNDDFTEIGGGVWGGKASVTGSECYTPDDAYVKENAIMNVVVKDLLTGNITEIPLVYPLSYPNRIFVSKLRLYEKRKYRCYKPFSENVLKFQ
jgi:hypothetical protein